MALIYTTTLTQNYIYASQIKLISHLDGQQTYVFYTVTSRSFNSMGMIEVLINENLADNQQLVIDKGTLSVPTADDNRNFGPLNIGGGSNYLLTMFDKFS